MVAYTGIQGQNILIVSSDPANPVEGQIWYNSTSNLLKGYQNVVVAAAWASGGNMNTARRYLAGFGTQTAAIGASAYDNTNALVGTTESYNGTSWTTVNPMAQGTTRTSGTGTQTAGLRIGGSAPYATTQNNTEEYNGTN